MVGRSTKHKVTEGLPCSTEVLAAMVSFASAPLLIVHALSYWSSHIPSFIFKLFFTFIFG